MCNEYSQCDFCYEKYADLKPVKRKNGIKDIFGNLINNKNVFGHLITDDLHICPYCYTDLRIRGEI